MQLTFKFSFTANMIKQKDLEWNVFDIIETQDSIQGKDDIDFDKRLHDNNQIQMYTVLLSCIHCI